MWIRNRTIASVAGLAVAFGVYCWRKQAGLKQEVAERERAQEVLRQNELRLRALLANAPAVLFALDGDGVITICEGQGLKALACDQAELVGQSIFDVYRDKPTVLEFARRALADEEIDTAVEVAGVTLGVTSFSPRDETGNVSGVVGVAIDVTQRRHAMEALQESEQRFRTLFEEFGDALLLHDEAGRMIDCNAEACRSLGYSREELLSLSVKDFAANLASGEEQLSESGMLWQHATPHELDAVVAGFHLAEHRRKDGTTFPVEVRVIPIDYGGERMMFAWARDITRLKRAAEALGESEERYRRLVELSPETIAVHAGGELVYVNTAGASLLGAASAEELVGKQVLDFVHPDYVELVETRIRSTQEESIPTDLVEIKMVCLDGEVMDVEARGIPVTYEGLPATQVVIRDITERKRAEEDLREAEELFRSAFDDGPVGMVIAGLDGRYLRVNRALCEILGYSEEELLATTFQDITYPEDADISDEYVQKVLAGEVDTYSLEKRYVHAGGYPVWVLLNVSAVRDHEDRPVCFLAQVQDIAERKRAEEELKEANRRLNELAVLKAAFSSMVAHELYSPLVAARGYLDMLATGELQPDEQKHALDGMRTELDMLSALVADARIAGNIDQEDFAVQPRKIPVSALLDDAVAFAGMLPGEHRLVLKAEAREQEVWADHYRVGQVLRNLLSNAAKYSPDGTAIELRVVMDGDHVRVEVADRGPGIHPDDAARIFEKFGRGRDPSGQKVAGVGLGLYLSQRIIKAQGGDLTLDSTPGAGSVFGFNLRTVR